MRFDPATDILGLIDVQPTFMPGGELPVAEGEAILPVIAALLAGPAVHAFATQDWHPRGHVSFASTHAAAAYTQVALPYGMQTLWPDHAIQNTPGAALHPALDTARVEVIVRKGHQMALDSYSAFFENDRATPTGLDGWLRGRGFRRLFLAGLATDFCVAWSAEDARRLGYAVVLIEDACRGIGLALPQGDTMAAARARLTAVGVEFTQSGELRR